MIKKTDLKDFNLRFVEILIDQLNIDIGISTDQEQNIRNEFNELKFYPTNKTKKLQEL